MKKLFYFLIKIYCFYSMGMCTIAYSAYKNHTLKSCTTVQKLPLEIVELSDSPATKIPK